MHVKMLLGKKSFAAFRINVLKSEGNSHVPCQLVDKRSDYTVVLLY